MRVGGKTPSSQWGHILTNVFQCECQLKVVFFFIIADQNITILVQQGTAIKKMLIWVKFHQMWVLEFEQGQYPKITLLYLIDTFLESLKQKTLVSAILT